MNIIDGNGASEVLRLSAIHANKVVKTQVQKKPPLSDSICIRCGAKAGLEHAIKPHDLKLLIINNIIPYQHRYQHEKSLVFGIEPGQSGPD